mmetsp:Transcript_178248/g.571390  ORF Transcript_178248/g.571390 Transcript_178248/m.571390 type:complete len:311 (+) Transcript_178248:644-1576(+)
MQSKSSPVVLRTAGVCRSTRAQDSFPTHVSRRNSTLFWACSTPKATRMLRVPQALARAGWTEALARPPTAPLSVPLLLPLPPWRLLPLPPPAPLPPPWLPAPVPAPALAPCRSMLPARPHATAMAAPLAAVAAPPAAVAPPVVLLAGRWAPRVMRVSETRPLASTAAVAPAVPAPTPGGAASTGRHRRRMDSRRWVQAMAHPGRRRGGDRARRKPRNPSSARPESARRPTAANTVLPPPMRRERRRRVRGRKVPATVGEATARARAKARARTTSRRGWIPTPLTTRRLIPSWRLSLQSTPASRITEGTLS